jgi:hypothetical protein
MPFEALLDRHERVELSQVEASRDAGDHGANVPALAPSAAPRGPVSSGRPADRQAVEPACCRGGDPADAGLYQEVYPDFTVRHFHEQLVKRHNYKLGYTDAAELACGAGLVRPASKRSAQRKRRPRRPLPGMMLHQDASRFAWLPGDDRQ